MPIWSNFLTQLGHCVPSNTWKALKNLLSPSSGPPTSGGALNTTDGAFKLSTSYTTAILVFIASVAITNQYSREVEIDCAVAGIAGGVGEGTHLKSSGTSGATGQNHNEWNTYCWNMGTFLVSKYLHPKYRGRVTYPGVHSYHKPSDELLHQNYYRSVWLGLLILAGICIAPYFIWKLIGTSKLRPIVSTSEDVDQRVSHFINTIGFNSTFSVWYIACKVFVTFTPLICWGYLVSFIGIHYTWYGPEVIIHYLRLKSSNPWPSPMDVNFPKMAKCEWSKFGYSGDIESKSAQCQLPMNNITQWSFLFLWFWFAIIFLVNLLSLGYFIYMASPLSRSRRYAKLISVMNEKTLQELLNEQLELDLGAGVELGSRLGGQGSVNNCLTIHSFIRAKLSLGDWLVLSLLKKNFDNSDFTEFLQTLVITQNSILQLSPEPTLRKVPNKAVRNLVPATTNRQQVSHDKNLAVALNGVPLVPSPTNPMLPSAPPASASTSASSSTSAEIINEIKASHQQQRQIGFVIPPSSVLQLQRLESQLVAAQQQQQPGPGPVRSRKSNIITIKPPAPIIKKSNNNKKDDDKKQNNNTNTSNSNNNKNDSYSYNNNSNSKSNNYYDEAWEANTTNKSKNNTNNNGYVYTYDNDNAAAAKDSRTPSCSSYKVDVDGNKLGTAYNEIYHSGDEDWEKKD